MKLDKFDVEYYNYMLKNENLSSTSERLVKICERFYKIITHLEEVNLIIKTDLAIANELSKVRLNMLVEQRHELDLLRLK